jgi:hypothetical protein
MTDAVPPGPTRFQGVPSDVELGGRRSPDQNGFVTALAVRAFRQAGAPIPSKWLDLLESCRRGCRVRVLACRASSGMGAGSAVGR